MLPPLAQAAGGRGMQGWQDAAELVDVLVDRCVIAAVRPGAIGRRRGRRLGPKAVAVEAGVSERAPNSDGAYAVQLVGVVETFRLERTRLNRAIAITVGLDAVNDILDARLIHAGDAQVAGGEVGRGHMMRVASSILDRDVVEQRSCAHDIDVRRLGLGDLDAQPGDAQHVVEVMGRIAATIEAPDFIFV